MVSPGRESQARTSEAGKSSQFGGNSLLSTMKRIWGRNGRLEPEEGQLQTLQDEETGQRPGPREPDWAGDGRETHTTYCHLLSRPSKLCAVAEPDDRV